MYVPGTDVRKRAVHANSFIAKSGIRSVDEGIAPDKGANLKQMQAVVDRLLRHFSDNGNELVLFDINRSAVTSILLVSDPGPLTDQLMNDASLPFAITLIANENPESANVVAHYKPPNSQEILTTESLGLAWPAGVISLSHVALPFSPDDPLYGRIPPEHDDVIYLGQVQIRGERGLLRISSDWLLRLRYNPFYSVLETRVLDWVNTIDADK